MEVGAAIICLSSWLSGSALLPAPVVKTPAVCPKRTSEDPFVLFVRKYYVPFILKTAAKLAILLSFILYISVAIYGIVNIKEGLEVEKLVPKTHHVAKFYETLKQYFYNRGQQVEIAINNAPNLTKPEERAKLHQMVEELEDTFYTMNNNATDFFLREYEKFLDDLKVSKDDTPKIWQRGLLDWSTMSLYRKSVAQDLAWRNATMVESKACTDCDKVLKSFRFRIGIKNFAATEDQRKAAGFIRSFSDRYPEYNLTSYHMEWPFVDQYSIIASSTLISISIAVLTMTAVAAIFFRDVFCVAWTVLAIISIDIGVLGFMSIWGARLDCVSMVCIIMSIGLSVDYTAHMVHGYAMAKGSINDRISTSLQRLGLPILQGGLSTLLGVCILSSSETIVVQVFFQVTFLAICFGMLHACAFLPVALSYGAVINSLFRCRKNKV